MIPLLCSCGIVFVLVYIDCLNNDNLPSQLIIALKYISPLILCIFTYYLIPKLVFSVMKLERFECKSYKEESFINKNALLMIFNGLILPIIVNAALSENVQLIGIQYPDHFHNLKGIT